MKGTLIEISHQVAWLEPYLPAGLLGLLALLAILYVITLRRIRFDLTLFSKALQNGLAMKNGMPDLPRFRSRDVQRISKHLNDVLKRQTHRVHWMLEFLMSTEAQLNSQVEANTSIFEAAQEQKKQLETLQETLVPHAESLEKLPLELTETMSGDQLQETGRTLDTVIESMESTLERMVATTQAVKKFEESAGEFENIAPLLCEMADDTQDLSLNARLAVSQSPGSAAERAVVSVSAMLEKKAKNIAADLLAEAGRIRDRTTLALSAQRTGNLSLLESSQYLEEARRDIQQFANFLNSSAQKIEHDLNEDRDRLAKVFSLLETLTLEAKKTISASEREISICKEAILAARKIQGYLRSVEISDIIEGEMAVSGVVSSPSSLEENPLPNSPEQSDEES